MYTHTHTVIEYKPLDALAPARLYPEDDREGDGRRGVVLSCESSPREVDE